MVANTLSSWLKWQTDTKYISDLPSDSKGILSLNIVFSVLKGLVQGIERPHSEIALAAVNVVVRVIPIQKSSFFNKKVL